MLLKSQLFFNIAKNYLYHFIRLPSTKIYQDLAYVKIFLNYFIFIRGENFFRKMIILVSKRFRCGKSCRLPEVPQGIRPSLDDSAAGAQVNFPPGCCTLDRFPTVCATRVDLTSRFLQFGVLENQCGRRELSRGSHQGGFGSTSPAHHFLRDCKATRRRNRCRITRVISLLFEMS